MIFCILSLSLIIACSVPSKSNENTDDAERTILLKADVTGLADINFTVTNDWESGFNASVDITNNGITSIDGRELTWTFSGNQEIPSLWNGDLTQLGNTVSVKNVVHNKVIGPDETVNFGFTANGAGLVPTNLILQSGDSSSCPTSSSSIGAAGPNADKIGIIYASWYPYHFENYSPYMNKIDEIKMKYVTVVPKYFIDTYVEGIRDNPAIIFYCRIYFYIFLSFLFYIKSLQKIQNLNQYFKKS